MTRKDIRNSADELLKRYEVDIQGNGYTLAVRDSFEKGDMVGNSIFFAQGEDAEQVIREARKYNRQWLTAEQAIIFYLDSAGALQ